MSKAAKDARDGLAGILAPKKNRADSVSEPPAKTEVIKPVAEKKYNRRHKSTNIAFPENVREQIFKWLSENPGDNQRTLLLKALKEFGFQVDDEDLKPLRQRFF